MDAALSVSRGFLDVHKGDEGSELPSMGWSQDDDDDDDSDDRYSRTRDSPKLNTLSL